MAIGIPKSEQAAMVGVVLIIAAGIGYQNFRSSKDDQGVWIDRKTSWQPVAMANADARTTSTLRLADSPRAGNQRSGGERLPASAAAIDINHATAVELERLPGIGPAKAKEILEARESMGGFRSIDDLLKVNGIGEKNLEKLRPYVTLKAAENSAQGSDSKNTNSEAAGSAPRSQPAAQSSPAGNASAAARPKVVNINRASQEELETIPGIGPALAQRIIEYRVRRPFQRPEDLINVEGIGPKTFEKMHPVVTVR